MIWLTVSAAACASAPAQIPARAFGKREINQHRHDGYHQPARQRQKAKGVRAAGKQEGYKRHQSKGGGQRHFIDRAIGAPVLRRHQFGGDRERRRNDAAGAEAGQQTQDDQLLGVLHQRDQQGEKRGGDHPDLHHHLAAPVIGYRRECEAADAEHQGRAGDEPADLGAGQMQRRLCQHQQGTGQRQIVALDKADESQHGDDQHVVSAERDAVELAARARSRPNLPTRPIGRISAMATSQIVRTRGAMRHPQTGEAGALPFLIKRFPACQPGILPTPHPFRRTAACPTGLTRCCPVPMRAAFSPLALLPGGTPHAGAATPSVTVSSWPTVSRPNAAG